MRGPLHEFLDIARILQVALNQALVGGRQSRLARQLLDVETVGLRRGNTSGRGVWLLEKPCVSQIRHYVADGSRAETLAIGAGKRGRSHRLARRDIGLDDGG